MQLAVGLAALFIGAALAISGVTKRSFSRLIMGEWDAPGSATTAATTGSTTAIPKTAITGGAHGQNGAPLTSFIPAGINRN